MDKQWAERRWFATPWDRVGKDEYAEGATDSSTVNRVLPPQARIAVPDSWDNHGNAWSAAMGAVGGAGTVLLIAVLVLIWRKPRRRELPLLAPMDVGQNARCLITAHLMLSEGVVEDGKVHLAWNGTGSQVRLPEHTVRCLAADDSTMTKALHFVHQHSKTTQFIIVPLRRGISVSVTKMSGLGPPGVWAAQKRLESWARAARERTSSASSGQSHNSTDSFGDDKSHGSPHEMLIPKEHCRIQPLSMEGRAASSLPHARLTRTPSISSQSSLDSGTSRATSHRGSSPAIRTFAPDGRTLEAGPGGPRSPSPLRAASLDVRAVPLAHGSLASLADSPAPTSPRHLPPRCLSPLLMPPRRIDRSNSLVESSSGVGPLSPGASAAVSALGALQPDLYTKREAPLVIELEGAGPSLGRIHLRLKYDFDRSDLEVHLIEAHDLAGYEAGGFNDPYVRVSLVPEVDTRVRQTPVHRNEANPFFDQHFKFPVSHDDLADKTLLLQVFDYDRFSRNEVMGSAKVPLSKVEVAGGAEVWAELSRERRPPEELQELLLSLSYLPSAERLTVVVLKARNLLPPQEGKDALDVYVKVYLLVNGKRVKKKKTNRKDLNSPVWNEALSFSLPSANLQEASIEVCVVVGGGGLVVGWCCVGAAEPAAEGRHWAQMAHHTRKAVAMWHTLR